MSTSRPNRRSSKPRSSFDYQRFLARRERLVNSAFVFFVTWFAIFIVVFIGSPWWELIARFQDITLWGNLTVARVLPLGAWVLAFFAIGGPWMLRNLHRPPQLLLLLRDFQSSTAAQLASSYVRRHGAAWGYWITLENADLRAIDSIGGEVETDPENENDPTEKPPIGAWWMTSSALGLASTTMLLLNHLESAPLRWMRRTSEDFGIIGTIAFGVIAITGICAIWLASTLIIRWVLLKVQRTIFLPKRINSEETFQRVLNAIFSRIRRRATTVTLGPLPVISVDDAWWKDAVLRCINEARLIVFIITARESAALTWEMNQVRHLFDPRRTLYIELDGDNLRLTDGNRNPIPGRASGSKEKRIEAAVHSMLVSAG